MEKKPEEKNKAIHRIRFLEEVCKLQTFSIDLLTSFTGFHGNKDQTHDLNYIFEKTQKSLTQILNFEALAFYTVDEEDNDFIVTFCEPTSFKKPIDEFVDFAIDEGKFAWALNHTEPVVVKNKSLGKDLILHVMATKSRVRGMFAGILGGDNSFCFKEKLKLSSVLIQNAADMVESAELYMMIQQKNMQLNDRLELQSEEINDLSTFPSESPYPVMRVDRDKKLLYANQSALDILSEWNCVVGDLIPETLREVAANVFAKKAHQEIELKKQGRVIALQFIYVNDKDYLNVYSIDITERKTAEEELLEAKNIAEKANSVKSDFLSQMSHELRTPMNAILGFGQLLELSKADPLTKWQKENVTEIMVAGNHLLALINEVLDLSKIEANKLELSLENVGVNFNINDSILLIKGRADDRKIKIIKSFNEDSENYVFADITRFRQILLNLLSNAVKYNVQGGSITVEVEKGSNKQICIKVWDTGPGISPEMQKSMFVPFDRLGLDASTVEGTGLGLTITKSLAELMDGSINYKYFPEKGSCFTICLPEGEKPAEVIASKEEVSKTEEETPEDKKYLVIYIEDNRINIDLVKKSLDFRPQIKFMAEERGDVGLELIFEKIPDLILLDINLPGMDGKEIIKRLKKDDRTKDIPVIAISANAMRNEITEALNLGFHSYITKPISVESFLSEVDKILKDLD
jgi:signal transduction histidine kinase/CheY-like chemotaxis protein